MLHATRLHYAICYTVYLVNSLPYLPYIRRIYMVLADPIVSPTNVTLSFETLMHCFRPKKYHPPPPSHTGMVDPADDEDEITFEEALTSQVLLGVPTFRLPFHPR